MRFYSIFILLVFISFQVAGIKPSNSLTASGGVSDMVIVGTLLYVATDHGAVDIFDLNTKGKVKSIKVPDVKDFMGDLIPAKVYSVDMNSQRNKVLIVCQGKSGFRNVFLYKNETLTKIFDAETDKLMVKKARFTSDETILLAMLSNELILFNLIKKEVVYRKQVSTSSFSDFELSKNFNYFISSDESGIIRRFETQTGELITEYKSEHVDNVYQVALGGNFIIGGGQDRRVSVYSQDKAISYHKQCDFLVYSVGISPEGKNGAYLMNEDNDICVFNIESKQTVEILNGHVTTATKILFTKENEMITSSDDPEILIWKF